MTDFNYSIQSVSVKKPLKYIIFWGVWDEKGSYLIMRSTINEISPTVCHQSAKVKLLYSSQVFCKFTTRALKRQGPYLVLSELRTRKHIILRLVSMFWIQIYRYQTIQSLLKLISLTDIVSCPFWYGVLSYRVYGPCHGKMWPGHMRTARAKVSLHIRSVGLRLSQPAYIEYIDV